MVAKAVRMDHDYVKHPPADLLADVGVIPPFKRSAQFSKEETEQTQAIAHLRIIVERVIGRTGVAFLHLEVSNLRWISFCAALHLNQAKPGQKEATLKGHTPDRLDWPRDVVRQGE
ncbi:unnamed protein product [Leuciscus chuanchicus]